MLKPSKNKHDWLGHGIYFWEMDGVYLSRSQSVILKRVHNVKFMPFAFTEEGVAMLLSVLRSPTAAEVEHRHKQLTGARASSHTTFYGGYVSPRTGFFPAGYCAYLPR